MPAPVLSSSRAFRTAWFSKAAKKAHISDIELCEAAAQVMRGQADDLGGGVYKKRLNQNLHRSLILAKGGRVWVFAYLFAKKDRANIESDELAGFRRLAKVYEVLTGAQIEELIRGGEWTEICYDNET